MGLSKAWQKANGDQGPLICLWKLKGLNDSKLRQALSFIRKNPPSEAARFGIIATLENTDIPTPEARDQFEAGRYLEISVPVSLKDASPEDIRKYINAEVEKVNALTTLAPDKPVRETLACDDEGEEMTLKAERELLDAINDPNNPGFGPC
jgi:hypothetical protein